MGNRICWYTFKFKLLCFSTMARSSGHSSQENTLPCSANMENIRGKSTFPPRRMEEATMDENLRQEIEELLEHLDTQEKTSASPPDEHQQGTEVIDVFIVRRQVEEPAPPTVESTLADTSEELETQAAPAGQETAERKMAEPPSPPLPRKPHRRALTFVVGALCVLEVGLLSAATLLLILAPSATVMIIPDSAQITATRTVTVVPSNANVAQQQIPGRPLATITLSQAKTVPATGTGYQQAQPPHGLLTSYNALPAPQTIPAGEMLTGADGIAVVTLQDAVIPAGK